MVRLRIQLQETAAESWSTSHEGASRSIVVVISQRSVTHEGGSYMKTGRRIVTSCKLKLSTPSVGRYTEGGRRVVINCKQKVSTQRLDQHVVIH